MKKFFKQIRQKLLTENKFSNYLIYAIGEILLVMIGILLALQVNNWNERQKAKSEEVIILNEIQENISTTIEKLVFGKSITKNASNSIQVVIKHLSYDMPLHDSLNRYFYNIHTFPVPEFASSGYETLKSKGLDLISNSNIRKNIIKVFDTELPRMVKAVVYDGQMRHEEYHNSEYIEHFRILSNDLHDYESLENNYLGINSKIEVVNYQDLMHDVRYENLLRSMFDNNQWFLSYYGETIENLTKLNFEINEELVKLK